jgi:hypothetical protein
VVVPVSRYLTPYRRRGWRRGEPVPLYVVPPNDPLGALFAVLGAVYRAGWRWYRSELTPFAQESPAPEDPDAYGRHYRNATLRVTDLPLAYGWIDNTYFSNCHLVGPAVLAINDLVYMERPGFPSLDVFFPIQAPRSYAGFIGVRRTAFVNCVFEGVGVAVDSRHYDELLRTAGAGSQFIIGESPSGPPPPEADG